MPDLYIHLGLQKTGTTFLQKCVFPYLDGVTFIRKLWAYDRLCDSENVRSVRFDEKILYSYENFSGIPFLNVDKVNRFTIVSNLYKLFPRAKIIFFVRDKDDWLCSLYKELVLQGLSLSFDDFVSGVDSSYLDFDKFIHYIELLFDDVLIVDYDKFKVDNYYGVRLICDFIGCSVPEYDSVIVRKSLTDNNVRLLRFVNRFFRCQYNVNGFVSRSLFTKLLYKVNGY